jgi:hypothetical protein
MDMHSDIRDGDGAALVKEVERMTPSKLLKTAIIPALADLAALGIKDSFEARRFLLAIALQESKISYRRQLSSGGLQNGPASSFWQFERGGGCRGVLTHKAVSERMRKICAEYNVEPTEQGLWEAMRYQDIVAAAAARLLVYTLPSSLPTTAEQGWKQYIDAWRPGKPHPAAWAAHWETADKTAKEAA